MKRLVQTAIYLLLALGSLALASCGLQGRDERTAFITRWKGIKDEVIQVPLYGKYTYSWETADGTVVKSEEVSMPDQVLLDIIVDADGEYLLKVYGEVLQLEFAYRVNTGHYMNHGTPNALLRVEQWGTSRWTSFAGAFFGCENMNIADNAGQPNLQGVYSMEYAFAGCKSLDSPMEKWNVSSVQTMRKLFNKCESFNQPLENWNVSRVTDMRGMFAGCNRFDQPLEKWDVSSVTDMRGMFFKCNLFNQPLQKWDVSQVTDMSGMFAKCSQFNQSLDGWDVSRVTNMSMMFAGCSSFNQPLARWNVSHVTDMSMMFALCSSFNQPLEEWDISNVTKINRMFFRCRVFDQPLGRWTPSSLEIIDPWYECGLSTGNLITTVSDWNKKRKWFKSNVVLNVPHTYYSETFIEALQRLKSEKGWVSLCFSSTLKDSEIASMLKEYEWSIN